MRKTAIFIMILTLGSKVFGFFRDITLSYFFGASYVSDAFLISQLIPMSILEFIGLGLLTGYIPLYGEVEKNEGNAKGILFTNNLVTTILIISTFLVFLGYIYTKSIVLIFASGFEGETLRLAITFTRISLFSIYFITLGYVFKGYLQIRGKYLVSIVTGYPLNIITIVGIILSAKFNLIFIAYGSLTAIFVQFVILVISSYKVGYRFKWVCDVTNPYMIKLWHLALPMFVGISVNQINVVVDRTLASRIVEGGISALNYANRLNFFVQGIFVISITTVMYPIISKLAAESNIQALKLKVRESINGVNLLLVPVSVGVLIYSKEITTLLFGRGMFDSDAISMTASATFFYSLGMLAFGLREVLSRTFYSLQDTKTPMVNASLGLLLNIALNLILSNLMGISGLALATSLSAIITTALLFYSLRKKIGGYGLKEVSFSFVKIVFSACIMAVVSRVSFEYLSKSISSNLALIFCIFIGAIIYFVVVYFMKIEDVDNIISEFREKVKWNASKK